MLTGHNQSRRSTATAPPHAGLAGSSFPASPCAACAFAAGWRLRQSQGGSFSWASCTTWMSAKAMFNTHRWPSQPSACAPLSAWSILPTSHPPTLAWTGSAKVARHFMRLAYKASFFYNPWFSGAWLVAPGQHLCTALPHPGLRPSKTLPSPTSLRPPPGRCPSPTPKGYFLTILFA